MNYSENSATSLAQSNYFQKVVENAGQADYNWFPLIECLTSEDEPANFAKGLLNCYFQLTEYVMNDQENSERQDLMEGLYNLKAIYLAIYAMTEEKEVKLRLNISEEDADQLKKMLNGHKKVINNQEERINKLCYEKSVLERKVKELSLQLGVGKEGSKKKN